LFPIIASNIIMSCLIVHFVYLLRVIESIIKLMARKTKKIIEAETNHVRRLLEDKAHIWTDKEIIEKLKMSAATLYRIKNRIESQDSELWQKQNVEDKKKWERLRLGPLEKRALDVVDALEEAASVCNEIKNDDEAPHAVRVEASKWAVKFRVNIYYWLERGPTPNMKVLDNGKDIQ